MTTLAIILMVSAFNVAQNPIGDLGRELRPTYGSLPEDVQPLYREARKARERGESELALEIYSQLAGRSSLSVDQRTYFLIQQELILSDMHQPAEALSVLDDIAAFRDDSPEIQYTAELQKAYKMARVGGALEGFDPTIEETEAQFKRVFSNPTSERMDTVKAYIVLAQECMVASQKDSRKGSYAQAALDYLEKAKMLLQTLSQRLDPDDTTTREKMDSLTAEVVGERESVARTIRETTKGGDEKASSESDLRDDAVQYSFNALLSPENAIEKSQSPGDSQGVTARHQTVDFGTAPIKDSEGVVRIGPIAQAATRGDDESRTSSDAWKKILPKSPARGIGVVLLVAALIICVFVYYLKFRARER